jgi:uncharacterized protein (TIGR03067 family)
MCRVRTHVLLALLAQLVPPLAAAPVPKVVRPKGDAERIVGTWSPDGGKAQWFRFDADGTQTAWRAEYRHSPNVYTVTLDPTASPKRMTWTAKGETDPSSQCVYELDGDRLRVAYVTAGEPWPAEVEAVAPEPGRGRFFVAQTRETSAEWGARVPPLPPATLNTPATVGRADRRDRHHRDGRTRQPPATHAREAHPARHRG